MQKPPKIFLAEDDPNFGAVLKAYLEMNDYEVVWVEDGAKAMLKFKSDTYDICILDIMLPNKDGFTIAKEIKQWNKYIPIVFLTAKTLKADVVQGFKLGADDYITKPFDSEVLLYKIKAILSRNKSLGDDDETTEFSIGKYLFNFKLRTLILEGNQQKLSPKEAELLRLLCLKANDVLNRDEALRSIWGNNDFFTTRSMDVFVTKLRKCLKDDPAIEIANIHGSGFRLIVN
jgi:two-component system, OmpR family, response regulator